MKDQISQKPSFNRELHLVRGIAVSLVVLCHAWEPLRSYPYLDMLVPTVFAIPLPVFFFISGFFGSKLFLTRKDQWQEMAKRQASRLMSVYFFCSALVVIFKIPLNRFADRPIQLGALLWDIIVYPSRNPMIVLWFLYVLFLMEIAFLGFHTLIRCNYRRWITAVIGFLALYALHAGSHLVSLKLFGLDLLAEYAVYFFLGFLCSLHYAKIKERLLPIRYWLLLGLGLYLFYPSLQSSWPATFPFAILSVFIVWSIAVIILAKSRSCRFCFEVFGDYAYGIYAYSYFFTVPIRILFMRILPISDVAVAAAALVVGLVFPPLLVKYVLSRNAFLRRWALGDWGSTDKGWVRVSISSGPTQLAQVTPPSD